MSWCRAVWLEPENGGFGEYEMTIPTKWVVGREVWYPRGLQVTNAFSRMEDPKPNWSKFPFLKYKLEKGDKDTCDAVADLTTSAETDINEEDESSQQKFKKSGKSKKPKNNSQSSGANNNACEESPVKKKPDWYPTTTLSLPGGSSMNLNQIDHTATEKSMSPQFIITPSPMSNKQHGSSPSPLNGASACLPRGLFDDQPSSKKPVADIIHSPSINNHLRKAKAQLNSSLHESPQLPLTPKYRSGGGNKYKEMNNKDFQYTTLMEMEKIKQNQDRILSILENTDSNFANDGDIESLEQSNSLDMFDREEVNLASRENRHLKRKVIRKLGGKDVRQAVRFALDALMTKELQLKFSKEGQRGKRNFTDTNHQKVITGALTSKYTKDKIVETTGDILKRAGDYVRRADQKKQRMEQAAMGTAADEENSDAEQST